MRLLDLNPQWENANGEPHSGTEYRRLGFDCPNHPGDRHHRLAIPVPPHPRAWQLTGEDFASLTLSPSIDFKHGNWSEKEGGDPKCHAHFYLRNGVIEML